MRTIKFRGFSQCFKKWLYGDLVVSGDGTVCVVERGAMEMDGHHIRQSADKPLYVDKKTVGQFTGLYDKNDNEIYEGDIVLWTRKRVHIGGRPLQDFSDVCKIYYNEKRCAFYFRYEMDYGACCGILDFNDDRAEISYIEVIGNIYDTPELLKA